MHNPHVSTWPTLYARVQPEVYAIVHALAEQRALPASTIVREALAKHFGQDAKKAA